MFSLDEIRKVLQRELETAKARYQAANAEFWSVCVIPQGLPSPEGASRFRMAASRQGNARRALLAVAGEFHLFLLHGVAPRRLRNDEEDPPPSDAPKAG